MSVVAVFVGQVIVASLWAGSMDTKEAELTRRIATIETTLASANTQANSNAVQLGRIEERLANLSKEVATQQAYIAALEATVAKTHR